MKIHKLEVENFRDLRNETFYFPSKPIVVIKDKNGIGKTSMLESIIFGLKGEIDWYSDPDTYGSVDALFSLRGRGRLVSRIHLQDGEYGLEIEINRPRRKKTYLTGSQKNDLRFSINGKNHKRDEFFELLAKSLGLEMLTFPYANFLSQNIIHEAIVSDAKLRAQVFGKLLRTDWITDIQDLLGERIKEASDNRKKLESEWNSQELVLKDSKLDHLYSEIQYQIKDIEGAGVRLVSKGKISLVDYTSRLEEIYSKLDGKKISKEIEKLTEKDLDAGMLNKHLNLIESSLHSLHKRQGNLEQISEELKLDFRSLISDNTQKIDKENELLALKNDLEDIKKTYEEHKEKCNTSLKKHKQLSERINALEKLRNEINDIRIQKQSKLHLYELEEGTISQAILDIKKQVREKKNLTDTYKGLIVNHKTISEELTELGQKINNKKHIVDKLSIEHTRFQADLNTLNVDLKSAEYWTGGQFFSASLEKIVIEDKTSTKRLSDLKHMLQQIKDVAIAYPSGNELSELKKYIDFISDLSDKDERTKIRDEITLLHDQLHRDEKKIENLKDTRKSLETVQESLKDNRKEKISAILATILLIAGLSILTTPLMLLGILPVILGLLLLVVPILPLSDRIIERNLPISSYINRNRYRNRNENTLSEVRRKLEKLEKEHILSNQLLSSKSEQARLMDKQSAITFVFKNPEAAKNTDKLMNSLVLIDTLSKRLGDMLDRLDNLNAMEPTKIEIQMLKSQEEESKRKFKESIESIGALNMALAKIPEDDVVPLVTKKVEEMLQDIKEKEKHIGDLSSLKNYLQEKDKEIAKLVEESEFDTIDTIEKKNREYKDELALSKKQHESNEKELLSQEKLVNEREQIVISKDLELTKVRQAIQIKIKTLGLSESELDQINDLDDLIEKKRGDLEEKNEHINTKVTDIQKIKDELVLIGEHYKRMEVINKTWIEHRDKVVQAEYRIQEIENSVKYLKELEISLKSILKAVGAENESYLDRIRKDVQADLRRFFDKLGGHRSLDDVDLNLKYSRNKMRADLSVGIAGSATGSPKALYSNGQQVALVISLFLAMAKPQLRSSKLNWIGLDEPTQFLDEDRKEAFIDTIMDFYQEVEDVQIFIATADQQLIELLEQTHSDLIEVTNFETLRNGTYKDEIPVREEKKLTPISRNSTKRLRLETSNMESVAAVLPKFSLAPPKAIKSDNDQLPEGKERKCSICQNIFFSIRYSNVCSNSECQIQYRSDMFS